MLRRPNAQPLLHSRINIADGQRGHGRGCLALLHVCIVIDGSIDRNELYTRIPHLKYERSRLSDVPSGSPCDASKTK